MISLALEALMIVLYVEVDNRLICLADDRWLGLQRCGYCMRSG